MAKINFEELASYVLLNARFLVTDIAPGGKMIGQEYTCATVQGGEGTSCKINVSTGKWMDGATGERGGDLISLYAAAYNVKQLEAAKQLAAKTGFQGAKRLPGPLPPPQANPEPTKSEPLFDLIPIPETVLTPTFGHHNFGNATSHWVYENEKGERLFWIARYDLPDGSKQFVPWSWCQNRARIVNKAWPEPRPLYGLKELKESKAKAVLVVEGEKAAEAARKFINPGTYTVVSWSGGSKAYAKTDWSPLYGKSVLLWPDNDRKMIKTEAEAKKYGLTVGEEIPEKSQPGMYAMLGIAEIIHAHCEVKIFSFRNTPIIQDIDGFDAADAYDAEWNHKRFVHMAGPLVQLYVSPPPESPEVEMVNTPWVTGSIDHEWSEARLTATKTGPHATMENVRRMIEYHPNLKGKIWFDEFHLRILTTWRTPDPIQWADSDELILCSIFQGQFGMHGIKPGIIRDGVRTYAFEHVKNEPRDWMNTLKWDGVERVNNFFNVALGTEKNVYTEAVSKNFWVAMVARVFHPGCKMDNMVIIEGEQGIFKSTALRAIASPWFTEVSCEAVTSKDFRQILTGHMIVEIAELTSLLKGNSQEEIKAILSDPDDYFRIPYGGAPANYNRTCIFVGTTNDTHYLEDSTGGRRYWPVKATKIDLDYIQNFRDQLFAEAVVKYKNKEDWWKMPDKEAREEQENRRSADEWEVPLREWLTTGRARGMDKIRLDDFIQTILGVQNLKDVDRRMSLRLSKIMRALGYENRNFKDDYGTQKRFWAKKNP